ncbi:MAG TPA: hypothetical protein VFN49_06115, partial [Candidatus Aquilonibacter sp.]|nr:hypothetical protein [Candidatus Aquilonibacter sp.]
MAVQQIVGDWSLMVGLRGNAKALTLLAPNVFRAHQAHNACTTAGLAGIAQISHEPTAAVRAFTLLVEREQTHPHFGITLAAFTRRTFAPGEEPGFRYAQSAAQVAQLPNAQVILNERIPHRECFANQTAVFLKRHALRED